LKRRLDKNSIKPELAHLAVTLVAKFRRLMSQSVLLRKNMTNYTLPIE
jgi:hypothetical protein